MQKYSLALNRFGLGARANQKISGSAESHLRRQLDKFDPRPTEIAALPSLPQLADHYRRFQGETRAFREAKRNRSAGNAQEQAAQKKKLARKGLQVKYIDAVNARLSAARQTENDFAERLVHFWANHFAISIDKPIVILVAGNYEFDAIRPHIMGKFSDLLLNAVNHTGMLLYLDQAQSIGPGSALAQDINKRRKRKFGLNENLAREILELHTLGVRSGYSQNDIKELARALTGWTVSGLGRKALARITEQHGEFGMPVFADALHEPGRRQIMGRTYPAGGKEQAIAVLSNLATHPATARHIATKLARHFTSDNPPPSLVSRLEADFLKSGGDLASLYHTLIASPEAWLQQVSPGKMAADQLKFKSPWDWIVSMERAMGKSLFANRKNGAVGVFRQLAQPVWRPESPAGYADTTRQWAGGAALLRRFEMARLIARQSDSDIDARALAKQILPGVLSANTAESIARAESPMQGAALLFMSPEFMRR